MTAWTCVCTTAELLPGEMKVAWDAETPIVVFNLDGDLYALEDRCSHEDFELSAGAIEGGRSNACCTAPASISAPATPCARLPMHRCRDSR